MVKIKMTDGSVFTVDKDLNYWQDQLSIYLDRCEAIRVGNDKQGYSLLNPYQVVKISDD